LLDYTFSNRFVKGMRVDEGSNLDTRMGAQRFLASVPGDT
jgi:hypothetical protein